MSFNSTLANWYLENKRDLPWRNSKNPYNIWLSEIILQQTQVKQGLPYYEKFISNFQHFMTWLVPLKQKYLNFGKDQATTQEQEIFTFQQNILQKNLMEYSKKQKRNFCYLRELETIRQALLHQFVTKRPLRLLMGMYIVFQLAILEWTHQLIAQKVLNNLRHQLHHYSQTQTWVIITRQ